MRITVFPCSRGGGGETSFQLETTYKLQAEFNYVLISNREELMKGGYKMR